MSTVLFSRSIISDQNAGDPKKASNSSICFPCAIDSKLSASEEVLLIVLILIQLHRSLIHRVLMNQC